MIGALVGAAAGAVIAARTPAEQVVVPQGTALGLRLDQPVEVRVRWPGAERERTGIEASRLQA